MCHNRTIIYISEHKNVTVGHCEQEKHSEHKKTGAIQHGQCTSYFFKHCCVTIGHCQVNMKNIVTTRHCQVNMKNIVTTEHCQVNMKNIFTTGHCQVNVKNIVSQQDTVNEHKKQQLLCHNKTLSVNVKDDGK